MNKYDFINLIKVQICERWPEWDMADSDMWDLYNKLHMFLPETISTSARKHKTEDGYRKPSAKKLVEYCRKIEPRTAGNMPQYHDIYLQDQNSGFFHQIITNHECSPDRAMQIANYECLRHNEMYSKDDWVVVHPATEQEMIDRKMELAAAKRVREKDKGNEQATSTPQKQTT